MAPALSSSFLPAQLPFKPRLHQPSRPATVVAKAADPSSEKKPFFLDIKLPKLTEVNGASAPSPAALVFGNRRRKDPLSVFVAGATGQAGARIARGLLRRGFSVRAGVPDLAAAQELAKLAAQYKLISSDESRRLNAVESGFNDPESIARSIGNATKVVVTVGPAEDGPAAAVSTDDALRVVQAAQLAGAEHIVIVYDGAAASPEAGGGNNVLEGISTFFSGLFSPKKQSLSVTQLLEKLATETELGFTLVKASLTDDVDQQGGLVVAVEGSGTVGEVPRSQIAALVGDVLSNVAVAENKVVEVSSSETAPQRPVEELFAGIAEDGRRREFKEAVARKIAEEEALVAAEKAAEAAAAAKKLEEEVKKLSEQEALAAGLAEEARRKAEAAGASVESIIAKAKNIGGDFSWGKLGSQLSSAITTKQNEEEEEPKVQVATVRGLAKARALLPQKAVVKASPPPQKTVVKVPPRKAPAKPAPVPAGRRSTPAPVPSQGKGIFGGLFQQETIYMDED